MMMGGKTEIIVGVLGQWASGKSTAAKTLIRYLGGKGEVIFITDREILAAQAVNHIRESEESKLKCTTEADGRRRLEGELTTIWLDPGEDLSSLCLNTLLFDLHDEIYDNVPAGACNWLDSVRLELGKQILARSVDGKPIVVEAGFGTNLEPKGENPFCHNLNDLFARLGESGLEPDRVKWILVEASYETRVARNQKRADSVPDVEFSRFAADGGDLDPDQQRKWEAQGTTIKRVSNEHDDIERFKAEIATAYDKLFAVKFSPSA